jgi:surface antigen
MIVRLISWSLVSGLLLVVAVTPARAANPFGTRSGFNLTAEDIKEMQAATAPFFSDDTVPLGTTRTWSNAKSGNSGAAKLVGRFEERGMPCRRIQHDIKVKRVHDLFHYVIDRCRTPDGTWKLL